MTSILKNVYIGKLGDIFNKYNNTYHSTIKIKPVNVKLSTYIISSKEINNKSPKSKVVDIVRISKYWNIFAGDYVPNCSNEVFVIVGTFYEEELQKVNQKELRMEKTVKRNDDKLIC